MTPRTDMPPRASVIPSVGLDLCILETMVDPIVRDSAARLRRLEERRAQAAAERRSKAQAWARDTTQVLVEADPSVERVIGFGSTFEMWRPYRMNSDVDLGIVGGNWSRLTAALPSGPFEVSIVELELQNAEFTDYVLCNGTVLYEKR